MTDTEARLLLNQSLIMSALITLIPNSIALELIKANEQTIEFVEKEIKDDLEKSTTITANS